MNEADTCRKWVTPMLQAAGWDVEPHRLSEPALLAYGPVGASLADARILYAFPAAGVQ